MAQKKPTTYQPDADYSVRLARVVDFRGMKLRPMHAYTLSGAALSGLPEDAIQSATLVRND